MSFHYRMFHQAIVTGVFLLAGTILAGAVPLERALAEPRPANDKPGPGTEVEHPPASAQSGREQQVVTPDKQRVSLVHVEIKDGDGGAVIMSGTELERGDKTSKIKVVFKKRASSVGSSMSVVKVFYEIAKARKCEYFTNLKEWSDQDGSRIYIGGFTNKMDADLKQEFGEQFDDNHESGQKRGLMSVSQFKPLFEEKAAANPEATAARLAQEEHARKIQKGDLSAATNEAERFEALIYAVKTASGAGRIEEARTLAKELERIAPKYQDHLWYGNAVQNFNQALGRIALAEGNIAEAKKRLLASADSKGSPTLNSFGPNMTLAKELLAMGEKDAVVQYFDLCAKFWKSDKESPAGGQLEKWKTQVRKGETPNFGANLWY